VTSQQRLTIGVVLNAFGVIALAALAYQTWGLVGAAITVFVCIAILGGYVALRTRRPRRQAARRRASYVWVGVAVAAVIVAVIAYDVIFR
jgi:cytochrome bd-type quinol oxidase subunit 2